MEFAALFGDGDALGGHRSVRGMQEVYGPFFPRVGRQSKRKWPGGVVDSKFKSQKENVSSRDKPR